MLKHILDKPVSVTMAMFVAIVLGFVSIRLLPVSLIPDVDVPCITVRVSAPRMSARELDEGVVRLLRQQLVQINSLEDITSETKDGNGIIKLDFNHGADMNYIFVEVNEKIDRSMSSIPEIERPRVMKTSASDIPAFYIDMTLEDDSPSAFRQASQFARDVVAKRIEQLPEVAMVDISGYVDDEILIVPNREKLVQLGLSIPDFEKIVSSSNIHLGALTIADGEYRYNVKFLSDVSGIGDIEKIWFRSGVRLLQLKDIADISQVAAQRTGMARSGGKDAICMAVIKQADARMADLNKGITELMSGFETDYPDLHFELTRDQTELLRYSIDNLIQNIVSGVLLACIVIFLFMKDFRSPLLVSLTMPAALVFSMAVFYLTGLSLNIISLSGLLLGVGMMTDNTVILVDNITARWQRTGNLRESVLKGTGEVMGPMLSSVLTTCAVFIPLVFVSGIAGTLFYDQAMAVTIVLMTSYIVTITVIPVYYWWWYKGMDSFRPNPFLEKMASRLSGGDLECRIMSWFLGHKHVSFAILGCSAVGIVMCFLFMPKTRLPDITYRDTILNIDWNSQVSLEQNAERIKHIEESIADNTLQVTSLIGAQQFVLSHSGDIGLSGARVYISCKDDEDLARTKEMLVSSLRSEYPQALFSFEIASNIFDLVFSGTEAPLTARLRPSGRPYAEVGELRSLLSSIRREYPSVPELPLKTDAMFVADPEKMALYGVSFSELATSLRTSLNENVLFYILQGSRTVPVVTGSNAKSLYDIISNASIVKKDKEIPVSEIMSETFAEDLKSIVAGTEGNYYPVDFDVSSREAPEVISKVRQIVYDSGKFDVGFSGSVFSNAEMIKEMTMVFIIALVLLYLILASQFESLVQPLIIMSEIIVDIFAAMVALWICGVSINIMSLIGIVVVSGIVINDSILKIDTINSLRKEGFALREAILEAGSRRFKAIVMTSLTTVLAVLPFLRRGNMGDDLQYPMSIVIIAGMTVGTLVSIFVLPVFYYMIYDGRKK